MAADVKKALLQITDAMKLTPVLPRLEIARKVSKISTIKAQ